jgi:hypothetical protein
MEVTRKLSLKAAQQVPWSSATSLLHEKDGVRRAWPMLPCLAAVLLIGLLGLYVWPSGRSLLGEDPLKAWDPQVKVKENLKPFQTLDFSKWDLGLNAQPNLHPEFMKIQSVIVESVGAQTPC